jgi:TRAP-type C4-dicarboxylate transport system permease small subunit
MNLNEFAQKICEKLLSIAAFAIIFVIFLIIVDVTLRVLRMPIAWGYEVVILMGAIAVGFSLPQTTFTKTHVIMEFGIGNLPKSWQIIFTFINRCLGIIVFMILSWWSLLYGNSLWRANQVSSILHLPDAIGPYFLGFSCFVVCIVLFNDLFHSLIRRS